MSYKKDFENLIKEMDENELSLFRDLILSSINTVGMEHSDHCLMNRPHSHSADCDCGADELQDKILRALE